MTENVPGDTGLVREEEFEATGPIEIDVAVGAGRIEVRLSDRSGVRVAVRHDDDAADQWVPGLSGLLNWVNGQFGTGTETSPDDAVRQTRVDLTGSRLVVRTPKPLPMRGVPLAIVIEAPNGSHVESKSGSASLVTTGSAGRLNVISGTGDVSVDRADGVASVNSGSAAVRLGPMMGGVRVKSGSGDIEVSSVGGRSALFTGSGDVWLGAVQADVMVRTGTGDITVADAACGAIELVTGSGELRVAVRSGTAAMVDLVSHAGQARSELDVSNTPPSKESKLTVRGRTGSGNAVITTAVG
ncbi:DUF4097 family beta strand repeat-containing protein [Kutzneria sp. CA-103260]|uniref:DUF4097 family beta strand repeat-containing protein n=1 Tax=Kutzneria sp. CA-103260 TaxID=2802641 RepID=UPI001BAD7051|nr:DUF4097 family beta strand repeat-containing protein [Kutzneria sp. CA-103260]QUQ71630.1 Putative adhesin [Kutzneria sp. CA-103260]